MLISFISENWKSLFGLLLFIFVFVFLYSCASYTKMLKSVPNAEFKLFKYHRGGNVTSATITATGAKIEGGKISFENIDIDLDYGPFVNWTIHLEGYRRTFLPTEENKRIEE